MRWRSPTIAYVERRTAEGLEEGRCPPPQAFSRPRNLRTVAPTQRSYNARACRVERLDVDRSFNGLYKTELIHHEGPMPNAATISGAAVLVSFLS